MTETMTLILTSAFEFLSDKHDTDAIEIIKAYANGEQAVIEQVNKLVEIGVEAALDVKSAINQARGI